MPPVLLKHAIAFLAHDSVRSLVAVQRTCTQWASASDKALDALWKGAYLQRFGVEGDDCAVAPEGSSTPWRRRWALRSNVERNWKDAACAVTVRPLAVSACESDGDRAFCVVELFERSGLLAVCVGCQALLLDLSASASALRAVESRSDEKTPTARDEDDGTIARWTLPGPVAHERSLRADDSDPSCRVLATILRDSSNVGCTIVQVWSVDEPHKPITVGRTLTVPGARSIDVRGRALVVATNRSFIRVFDWQTGEWLRTLDCALDGGRAERVMFGARTTDVFVVSDTSVCLVRARDGHSKREDDDKDASERLSEVSCLVIRPAPDRETHEGVIHGAQSFVDKRNGRLVYARTW